MDLSKILEDNTEECSSNESGWTMYLGSSSDHELDYVHEEAEEDCSSVEKNEKKPAKEDGHVDVYSDDSMASDASSGPSNLHGHVLRNKDVRKNVGKKQQKEDKKQHDEHMKAAKDEGSGHKANSGKRSNRK